MGGVWAADVRLQAGMYRSAFHRRGASPCRLSAVSLSQHKVVGGQGVKLGAGAGYRPAALWMRVNRPNIPVLAARPREHRGDGGPASNTRCGAPGTRCLAEEADRAAPETLCWLSRRAVNGWRAAWAAALLPRALGRHLAASSHSHCIQAQVWCRHRWVDCFDLV